MAAPVAFSTPMKVGGKRAQKAVDSATDNLVQAVGMACDIALEAEIEFVTNAFRKDPATLHTVSALLKNDSLKAILDGRMHAAQREQESSPAAPSQRVVKFKKCLKRWKHLDQQLVVVVMALRKMEPLWFEGPGMRH